MKTIVISLGGSVIVPKHINASFLMNFKKLILKKIETDYKFFIITGGGYTCRMYNKGAQEIMRTQKDDLDWLGIQCTILNAHLIKTIFKNEAYKNIISNPRDMRNKINKSIVIVSGWEPKSSSDFVAVSIARRYGIKRLINISNIAYVYNKNPKEYTDAIPIKDIKWKDFRKIVGNKWKPGINMPFDPIASKLAQKIGLEVNVISPDIKNLDNCIKGKNFIGTIIS